MDRVMNMMTIDIGNRFHPLHRNDAVYRVIGVRAGMAGAPHALLVVDAPDQGALAVPLEILTDPRYWLPLD